MEIKEAKSKHGLTSSRFKGLSMSDRAKEVTDKAKKKHRTDIKSKDWIRYNLYKSDFCDEMLKNPLKGMYEITVIDGKSLSIEEFRDKYESKKIPLVIRNLTDKWKAQKYWNFERLYKDFKDSKVKVGEDDDGYKIKIKFKYFLEYMIYNIDDSPLYLFESSFENHKKLKMLLKDYEVPSLFKEDLFEVIGEKRRPPYRWFLIGPKRSGTSIHTDPLGTSAWNASLNGNKLWLLMPPDIPKNIAKGKEFYTKDDEDESINYFMDIFPKIKSKYGDYLREIIFIQKKNETVFIPGGWWHVVLNLDDTIAVTQNYCNSVNFEKIWLHVRSERKKMAVKFLRQLELKYPELAGKAKELNIRDNFLMYDEKKLLSQKRFNEDNCEESMNMLKLDSNNETTTKEHDKNADSSSSSSSNSSSSSSSETE